MIKLKLFSLVTKKTSDIKPAKRSITLFVILLLAGFVVAYIGLGVGNLLGLVIILFGVACVMAGCMQIIGVAECNCPDCGTKGYIYKRAKKYKCKECNMISVVVKQDEKRNEEG